ncbi:HAD-IA family hydrolase [Clostridium estertheticum]|uniref:HAD-IA family hydrolase n=1 Tax=Clostridium estertheticum TaxID=238834 RepID=UPI0013E96E8C|nr:HAD-IA family hydrolase [Clostridium estertheticum]MBZ9686355.1 HAD-IA family hydrolase [Clostridium estertheticum]
MIDPKIIKAILFDSGRVLNRPRTGQWFMPPNFFKYVDKNKFETLNIDLIENAFHKGDKYFHDHPLILTEKEELKHFIEFYNIFSKELPELKISADYISEIAKDTVYNDDKFEFFEDVFQVIPRLSQNFKLGVVSDTWPSLERVFKNAGLREYFSTFVMSSTLGVLKPDELMFNTALSQLNIEAEAAIFIDDNIVNVKAAIKLGMQGIVILRGDELKECTDIMCVDDLSELEELLAK